MGGREQPADGLVRGAGDRLLHVADKRNRESLAQWYRAQGPEVLAGLEAVAMDMWAPYVEASRAWLPDAQAKIAFDRFHVARHLSQAVDTVRRQEHRGLRAAGASPLTGTRYLWLKRPAHLNRRHQAELNGLRRANLKTARAWAIKEQAAGLWDYRTRGWVRRGWLQWYQWAIRSRLEPIKRVARTVKANLEGIVTAVVTGATTARSEGFNAMIQKIKSRARGYRNRDRFRAAIYFHLGGLDLYPDSLRTASPT